MNTVANAKSVNSDFKRKYFNNGQCNRNTAMNLTKKTDNTYR
jgi:hypothetical protein